MDAAAAAILSAANAAQFPNWWAWPAGKPAAGWWKRAATAGDDAGQVNEPFPSTISHEWFVD